VTLNREKNHNTFNDVVIGRFQEVFTEVAEDRSIRGVFVESKGKFFSAGGDLKWMKRAGLEYTEEQNTEDAMALSGMLHQLNSLPQPTVALVQGPCFGGGVGLVSCCDIAIGVPEVTFTLSEVKLGILPATISPYVVAKIGANQARRYFLTAEMFDARQAERMGLLNEVAGTGEGEKTLEEWKDALKAQLTLCAPTGVAASKELIRAVDRPVTPEVMADTAARLSRQRQSEEGQAGLHAFLNKEKAPWVNGVY
jgi:methylglutaconyl-CoA hydratase